LGTPVVAAREGDIDRVGNDNVYGNYLIIKGSIFSDSVKLL
jgi:murein DD-endopeptidase MepM/ murein hydrolase activator NlpD